MAKRSYLCLAVALLATVAWACGGNDGAGGTSDVLYQRTAMIGPAGGMIDSGRSEVRVAFPAGALTRATAVTLTVNAGQFAAVERPGYAYSPNGVRVTFDASALAASGAVEFEVPVEGPYDAFASLLGVQTDTGVFNALPSAASDAAGIGGQLDQVMLAAMFEQAASPQPRTLMVFSANRLERGGELPPFATSVLPFQDGRFAGKVPDLSGKTVVVLLHGIEADLPDLVQLGQFMAQYTRSGESSPYYDAVIGFQYTSNRDLMTIGTAFADAMQAAGLQNAAVADVIAHSLGNLVARYAMETTALPNRIGNVSNYIALGGPHTGVPFGKFRHTEQAFFYLFDPSSEPCILDLLTDGRDGAPQSTFLTTLNLGADQMGPNFHTTRYFAMSGDDYRSESPPLGLAVHLLYIATAGSGEPDDGLVAQYSAQSTVLDRQSASWSPNAPLHVSHKQLHTAQQAFDQIAAWLDSSS